MNLLKFVNKIASENEETEMVSKIRSVLYKNYIKTVVEAVDDSSDGFRMIFIGNRIKSDFNNPITVECNGAVLWYSREDNKFSVLTMPPHLFNSTKMTTKEIENKYKSGAYKCYPVLDGTISTLYFFKGSWRLSTSKAYDATKLPMINGKTYEDIFYESGGTTEGLDEAYCYTVCIKNDSFHVFNKGSNVTFLQRVNIETKEKEVFQEESIAMSWKSLKNNLHNAVHSFKSKKQVFFGVILRSESESILLESNLMIKLRNFLYNFSFAKKMNPECDLTFASMVYVYLNRRDVSLYLTLFPFYKKEFNRFNQILESNARLVLEGKPANSLCERAIADLESKKIELPKSEGLKIAVDFMRSTIYLNEFYELIKF